MNILGVSSVVNEFIKAWVTVLQNVEERICFPSHFKEIVSEIVGSVYNDILWEYELQVVYGNNYVNSRIDN
jgi:hypothetical protein